VLSKWTQRYELEKELQKKIDEKLDYDNNTNSEGKTEKQWHFLSTNMSMDAVLAIAKSNWSASKDSKNYQKYAYAFWWIKPLKDIQRVRRMAVKR
jgi:hypothetical protein